MTTQQKVLKCGAGLRACQDTHNDRHGGLSHILHRQDACATPSRLGDLSWKREHRGRADFYLDCVHCGLCLAQCPTYRELGYEADSPRGRLFLMRAAEEGAIPWNARVADHLDLCLGCRACESACPAGVRYERLLEESRAAIENTRQRNGVTRALRYLVFQQLFRYPWALHLAARLLRLYQISGLRFLLRRSGLLPRLSTKWAELEQLLPDIPSSSALLPKGKSFPAFGQRRYRVAFFTGCVMDETMAAIQHDTVEVLRHNGCEVIVPEGQVCCGAIHSHSGELQSAVQRMETNVRIFADLEVDGIISNAAGCGAILKEYGRWAAEYAPALYDNAMKMASRVEDISRFLVRIGCRLPEGKIAKRVAYDDPCHLIHGQKISAEPRQLLKSIPGIEWVELPDADQCCGSAGTYNLMQYDLSMRILEKKMKNIASVHPDIVATGNPGCLLQLRYGARRFGVPVEIRHPVELLAEMYRQNRNTQELARRI